MPRPLPLGAAIVLGAAMLAGLALGGHLFRLAARTGGFPEIALGTFAVSSALGNLGMVAAMRLDARDPDFANLLAACARRSSSVGNHGLALATWRSDRRGRVWAAALVAAASVTLLAGWSGSVLSGRPARLTESPIGDSLVLWARLAIFAW